jgi:hypothetical protein
MSKEREKLPKDFDLDSYREGAGCECCAYYRGECACGADWTPKEVYRLKLRVNELLGAQVSSSSDCIDCGSKNTRLESDLEGAAIYCLDCCSVNEL